MKPAAHLASKTWAIFGPKYHEVIDNVTATAGLAHVPAYLLESFLPGFGVISRFLINALGLDITFLVSACFIAIAVISALSFVWRPIYGTWRYWFTCSISIQSTDKLFDQVIYWISKQKFTEQSRALTAKSDATPGDNMMSRLDRAVWRVPQTGYNFGAMEASSPPMYSPSYGKHRFWHQGRYFVFHRELQNQPNIDGIVKQARTGIPASDKETIHLTCLGRSPAPVKQLLMECKRLYAKTSASTTTIRKPHANFNGHWVTATTRPSRPLDTIYMDDNRKQEVFLDMLDFLDHSSPQFYARRGIPYRRGYLFYGLPGTGKTSLSFALAGVFGLDVYVLTLREPAMSDQKLADQFSHLPARCIVLLEDIDTAGLKKRVAENDLPEEKPQAKQEMEPRVGRSSGRGLRGMLSSVNSNTSNTSEGVSLSGLLNAIDGVASPEGRLLVMTTNQPESLDPALVRPGRIDMQVHFGLASKNHAREIFLRMYSKDPEEIAPTNSRDGSNSDQAIPLEKESFELQRESPELLEMALQFADCLPELAFSPAEVQGFLLARRKSPHQALKDTPKWRDDLLVTKAAGMNIIGTSGAEKIQPSGP